MIVSIHQPNFLPWLGFFHKMAQCDKFIILDNVQFARRMFFHRTKIKTSQKQALWLTIPVHDRYGETNINEIIIDNSQNWKDKHLKSIIMNYHKAEFFSEYIKFFEEIFNDNWEILSDLTITIIKLLASVLEIKTEIILASDLQVTGKSTELLINLCKKVKATSYISGPSGKKYLKENEFEKNSIELIYHKFNHPEYNQLYGPFMSNLSVIDLLFNCGSESRNILLGKSEK